MQKAVSVGFGYQPDPGGNVLGFGFNWGEVNEDTWGLGTERPVDHRALLSLEPLAPIRHHS